MISKEKFKSLIDEIALYLPLLHYWNNYNAYNFLNQRKFVYAKERSKRELIQNERKLSKKERERINVINLDKQQYAISLINLYKSVTQNCDLHGLKMLEQIWFEFKKEGYHKIADKRYY